MPRRNNIAAERARLNMSQQDLASKLQTTRKTVGSYEAGGDIPASKLILLSTIFGVSTDYLLGLDMSMHGGQKQLEEG